MYWVHHENEELQEKLELLLRAKNIIVRTNMIMQVYNNGSFKIPKNPFKNTCKRCHGTGELYLFNRVFKKVKCNRCHKGKLWIPCRVCKATGKYKIEFDGDGGTLVDCVKCKPPEGVKLEDWKHKGHVQVKCHRCEGTGKARIPVLDHTLKSMTACPVCDQLGFFLKSEKKSYHKKGTDPDNPALPGNLAEKLKHQIDDNKFFDQKENAE
jgi:DnaJ-class molecular chaperone